MVNTLGNTPEKITSTPNKSGSGMLKKIVAGAIALTLSGQPVESKTYEKQEFPTEMIANVPGEISPMTENVEQTNVPNYISQAETAVRKYYPKYEEYFKPILELFKTLDPKDKNTINGIIKENLELYSIDIKTEKDKRTTILIAFEKLDLKKSFQEAKDVQIINQSVGYDLRESIACEIEDAVNKDIIEKKKKLEYTNGIINELDKRIDKLLKNKITRAEKEEMIDLIEDLFLLTYDTEIISKSNLDIITKLYVDLTKEINRNPNELGKKIIREYNTRKH